MTRSNYPYYGVAVCAKGTPGVFMSWDDAKAQLALEKGVTEKWQGFHSMDGE
jgi:hypothetical protein